MNGGHLGGIRELTECALRIPGKVARNPIGALFFSSFTGLVAISF